MSPRSPIKDGPGYKLFLLWVLPPVAFCPKACGIGGWERKPGRELGALSASLSPSPAGGRMGGPSVEFGPLALRREQKTPLLFRLPLSCLWQV